MEEQPQIPPKVERAGPFHQLFAPQVEVFNIAPPPRYLFISRDGTEILQIQHNRFGYNWRKRTEADIYPRFEAIKTKFNQYADIFMAFVRNNGFGQVRVTQGELTYVNRIETPSVPGRKSSICVFGGYTDEFLHDPEEVLLALKFQMMEQNEFRGRLYIDVRPNTSIETTELLNMVLLARGTPKGNDIKATLEFFQLARKYIVSGFASVTSKQMHTMWGRTDNA